MNYRIVENPNHPYVEMLGASAPIQGEREALEWVALCAENGTDRLLLNTDCLTDDFFHLSTGVAGAILLKFSNYRIKVAALSTPELVNQGKFRDMALETNRGSAFRIFYDHEKAEQWLTSD
jgi:PadR family transcriptional regulator AphA